MSVADEYQIVDYFPEQWRELDSLGARAAYKQLIASIPTRLDELARESRIRLDGSEESLQDLSDWMADSARPSPSNDWVPDPTWRSIARDIGLYLGEALIRARPWLTWELRQTGPTHAYYREPVVRGFRNVSAKSYEIGPCDVAFGFACNALNAARTETVTIGDSALEIDLGPLRRDQLIRLLKSSLDYA